MGTFGEESTTSNATTVAFEISPIRYHGNQFSVTARVIYGEEQEKFDFACQCFDNNGRLITNNTVIMQNANTAEVEVFAAIPAEGGEFRLDLKSGFKRPKRYSDKLSIPAPKDLLLVRTHMPERVTNGMPDSDYPDNDVYTSQKGDRIMDLFMPVAVNITPGTKYMLKKLSNICMVLNGPGGEFKHCAPQKRWEITVKDSDGNIRFPAEWKNRIPASNGMEATYQIGFQFDAEIECAPHNKKETGLRTIHWDSKTVSSLGAALITWEAGE